MKPIPQYLTKQTVRNVCNYLASIVEEGNYKVSFKPVAQRTIDQNKKLQAVCSDIANQVGLDTINGGYKLKSECKFYREFSLSDIRHILMAGYTKAEIVPGIERGQAVCLYPSTTDLSLSRGSEFIEYALAFGAEMGVEWTDEQT